MHIFRIYSYGCALCRLILHELIVYDDAIPCYFVGNLGYRYFEMTTRWFRELKSTIVKSVVFGVYFRKILLVLTTSNEIHNVFCGFDKVVF